MNNWRLLLLAVVAVFQPIASFTESNLVDGRQQCCDRLSSAQLRDTGSLLHGTYRLDQTRSALRRLNDREEIREDRRYGLKHRDSIFGRSLTERRLVQERGASQGPFAEARSTRVEYRHVRIANGRSHDRLLDVNERERTARNIQDLKPQDLTRRVDDRISRNTLEHGYTKSSRDSLSRYDIRAHRFVNRLSNRFFDSQRENQREEFRSGELRVTLNRDERHVLRRTNGETGRIDNNNVRRDLERNKNQGRSLSENRLVDRTHDMRIRLNSREKNHENYQRNAKPLFSTEQIERREQRGFRQQNKENSYRRLSGERMQMARRTRESRIMNEQNTQNEREIRAQETRNNERMSIERQDGFGENADQRLTHERIQIDRRNTREARLITTRIKNTRNKRDEHERREVRHTEEMSIETRDELRKISKHRLFRERAQMGRRNIREARILSIRNEKALDERREIKPNARMSMETQDRSKEHLNQRLSRERAQMDRRNTREARILNIRNERDEDERQEIRLNARMSMETEDRLKEHSNQRLSRERAQMDRRDTREARILNIRNERDEDERQEIRLNARMSMETQDRLKGDSNQRLSRERAQVDRRDTREARILNIRNERDEYERRETRHNARMSMEIQDRSREHSNQRLSRERAQMDRRDTREARISNIRNERNLDERREISHNAKISMETQDRLRETSNQRLSRERAQIDRRSSNEARIIKTHIERDVDGRRENRQNDRISMETRDELIKILDRRLSRERSQIDRKNTREARIINIRNERDLNEQREMNHHARASIHIRDERQHYDDRRTLERRQMERRNFREIRVINNMITRNDRDIGSLREISNMEILSRVTRYEIRQNSDSKLSRERIQIERRNIREFRALNSPSERDIDNRRESRYTDRITTEIREDPDHRFSRGRIQMDRRLTREIRFIARIEKDIESRREIRYDERLPTKTRENPEQRLSRERIQMDRRNTRDPIMNRENSNSRLSRERIQVERRNIREFTKTTTPNERDVQSGQEIRYNERLSQDEIRENSDRRLARERRQTNHRDIRESRTINRVTRNFNERDIESRREIRFNERLTGQVRSDQFTKERRMVSKSLDRVISAERENSESERRARSLERRNFREIRATPTLSRSADLERRSQTIRSRVEHRKKVENREREAIDARSRNVDSTGNRDRITSEIGKMETESNSIIGNWQYVLYTLQAAYLCALFVQMLTPSRTEKSTKMSLRWLPISSHYNPIKVD